MKKMLIVVIIMFVASISLFIYVYNIYNVKTSNDFNKNNYYILKGTYNILKETIEQSASSWGKGERFTKKTKYVELNIDSLKNELIDREYDLYYQKTAKCITIMEDLLSTKELIGEDYETFERKYNKITKKAEKLFMELEEII